MPYVKNSLAHDINPTGDKWVPAGAVVEVEDAAPYTRFDGVEESSQEDFDAQFRGGPTAEKSPRQELVEDLDERAAALNTEMVAAPLQVVVGDDEAPYGPPSGTITTKAIEAGKDHAHRVAFADHEALNRVPDELEGNVGLTSTPNSAKVHNLQAEAKERAEELAQEQARALGAEADEKPKRRGGRKAKATPDAVEPDEKL
jgi:hypothetical protein